LEAGFSNFSIREFDPLDLTSLYHIHSSVPFVRRDRVPRAGLFILRDECVEPMRAWTSRRLDDDRPTLYAQVDLVFETEAVMTTFRKGRGASARIIPYKEGESRRAAIVAALADYRHDDGSTFDIRAAKEGRR